MADDAQLQLGAWVGYDKHWKFGPLSVTRRGVAGRRASSCRASRRYFHGELWLHGEGRAEGLRLRARRERRRAAVRRRVRPVPRQGRVQRRHQPAVAAARLQRRHHPGMGTDAGRAAAAGSAEGDRGRALQVDGQLAAAARHAAAARRSRRRRRLPRRAAAGPAAGRRAAGRNAGGTDGCAPAPDLRTRRPRRRRHRREPQPALAVGRPARVGVDRRPVQPGEGPLAVRFAVTEVDAGALERHGVGGRGAQGGDAERARRARALRLLGPDAAAALRHGRAGNGPPGRPDEAVAVVQDALRLQPPRRQRLGRVVHRHVHHLSLHSAGSRADHLL